MWIHGRSPYLPSLPSPNPSPWSWLPVSNTPLQSILKVVIPGGHAKGFLPPDFSTALPTITWYYCIIYYNILQSITIYYNLLCILLLSLTLHLLYLLTLVVAPVRQRERNAIPGQPRQPPRPGMTMASRIVFGATKNTHQVVLRSHSAPVKKSILLKNHETPMMI